MRIGVFGVGAIGGYIGALLARSGVDVSLIARGPHLNAIRERGLSLRGRTGQFTVQPFCTDDPAAAGPQDVVILAVKAHVVADIVDRLAPLLGPATAVVGAQNGLPWWYFHKHGGAYDDQRLASVDPGGVQWRGIGPERALGCVVWQAARVVAPGVIEHTFGDNMVLGEPDGSRSDRALALAEVLTGAGIETTVEPDIRQQIWLKLWGNLSFNPVSVLTHATLQGLALDRGARAVIGAMMAESREVGERLGVSFPLSIEQRIKAAADVGPHKSSMLQDLEAGRTMEIEPLIGVIVELGRLVGVPTPTIEMIYDLVVLRARQADDR